MTLVIGVPFVTEQLKLIVSPSVARICDGYIETLSGANERVDQRRERERERERERNKKDFTKHFLSDQYITICNEYIFQI